MNQNQDLDNISGEVKTNRSNIIELFGIFKKYRKYILIITLVVCIITFILMFFVFDPIFVSSGTIKSASKSGGLSNLLGSSMPDLGDLGGLSGGFNSSGQELALYQNILLSRRCVEETILKFKLNEEWDFKYMFDATKFFRENVMDIKKDKIAGTMEIDVYDKNPERAKEIADFLIYQLNKIFVELNVQNAKNSRMFIETRYELVKKDLKQAEDSLKDYQNIFGVAPDLVIKAATQTEIQLEGEIKSEELKLELLRKVLSSGESEIKMQEDKIEALKTQLNNILNSTEKTGNLNLKGSPEIVMNFMRLQRSVEIQNKIMTFILPMYEQAKIEENRETPSILILDQPNVPDRKVKPKRLTNVAIATLLCFLLSYLYFVILDKIKMLRQTFKENSINK